jgi:hypothetical protein
MLIQLVGRKHTYYKEKNRSLVVSNKDSGLEVNANKTKYMVMSRDQNAGRSHNIKNYDSFFERVEQLNYLGTTQMNQSSIQEGNKNTLHSGNACYHLQNLWSSSLLSKNIKIKIKRTVILTVVCIGMKLGLSH